MNGVMCGQQWHVDQIFLYQILRIGAFCVNKLGCMLGDMSLEGVNYVQDFPELFFEIEQYHAR